MYLPAKLQTELIDTRCYQLCSFNL